jgi:AraC-like DNA-binding protein
MISRYKNFRLHDLLLYLPAIIILTFNIFRYHYITKPDSIFHLNNYDGICLNFILIASGAIYETLLSIIAFNNIRLYVHSLEHFFSKINRLQMTLLRITLGVYLTLEVAVAMVYRSKGDLTYRPGISDSTIMLIALILFLIFAFLAAVQPELLSVIKTGNSQVEESNTLRPKYEKSRLGTDKEEAIASKLEQVMIFNKPYLSEEITLSDIAVLLSVTTHQLSMIINLHFNMNFYTFINKYRIEEAKQILSAPENRDANILSIAFRSGFNSKTTFNAMFKKFTGITPSQYRSNLNRSK